MKVEAQSREMQPQAKEAGSRQKLQSWSELGHTVSAPEMAAGSGKVMILRSCPIW